MEFAQKSTRSFNNDSKPYAKYPSSSGSKDLALTRFFYCDNGKVEKGA